MQQFPGQFGGGMQPMGFNQGFGSMPQMQQPMGMGMMGMGGLPPLGGPGMPPLVPMGGMGGGGPAQTMPPVHGPAQVSLAELRIKPHEAQLFDQLFQFCDPTGTGLITGGQIKSLMTKSKLNKNILAGIWALSDKQKRKALDRENFAVALRLVALAQNGLPVSELGLKQYCDIPPPVFDGLQLGGGQQQQQPQQQQQQQSQQPSMDQSFGSPSPAASAAPTSEWAMTSDERAQYASLFSQADEDQDGFVNAKEAKFFKQSGLDNKSLKTVWLLADQDKDNKLNPEEFSVAMHLTLKVRKGLTLPTTLPDVLSTNKKSSSTTSSTTSSPPNGFDSSFNSSQSQQSSSMDFNPPPQKTSNGFDDFGSMSSSSAPPSLDNSSNGFSSAPPQPAPIQPTNFFPGGSAQAFINSPEEEQEKYRILSRTLSTAQSSVHHQNDQLKGLQEQLSLFNAKTKLLFEQVNKTGQEFTHVQQLIQEEQIKIEAKKQEMAKLDSDNNGILTKIEQARADLEAKKTELKELSQKIIDAHTTIPSIKKETTEIDMQIAIAESQLQQSRQTWKQIEDTKNTQSSILSARKDQAAKLLREKQEVQEMLDQAQLELAKIKNEATVVKENIPIIHSSIADMRNDLKELNELVEEERKNPTARSQVSINAKGELQLGAAKPPPPAVVNKPAASAAAKSAASLGFGDDDDDFAVPDIQLPGQSSNKITPPKTSAPPPPAAAAAPVASKMSMFDDGDDFAVPDIALPSLGGSKPAAAPIAKSASSGFDDFGDFGDGPGSAAPAAAASSSGASDPFGASEDWGADPFASTSSTVSAPSASSSGSVTASAGFDDFGGDFGSSGFGSAPPASKPAPPPSMASPRGAASPPPPPPKSITIPLTSSKPATPPQAPLKPAGAMASFADDDGWDVPDGVAGGDAVKTADWSQQAAAGHDDWGF